MKEVLAATKQALLDHLKNTGENIATSKDTTAIYELLPAFMQRGKCVRGSLVLLTANAFGKTTDTEVLNCGLALEYFQAMILIIDDMMDDDDVRRGSPTIHRAIEQEITKNEKRGRDYAMCLSLNATFDGFRLLKNIDPQINEVIWKYISLTSFAQINETQYTTQKQITIEQILDVYKNKTGKYTFSLPFCVGALLAKQDAKTLEVLEKAGEEIGVLFQIRDDMLELIGTTESIGKSISTDIRNNIHTYQRTLLQNKVSEEEEQQLQEIFGEEPSSDQIEVLQELYAKYNIVSALEEDLGSRKEQLLSTITTLPNQVQQLLIKLAEYCITRTK